MSSPQIPATTMATNATTRAFTGGSAVGPRIPLRGPLGPCTPLRGPLGPWSGNDGSSGSGTRRS